MEKLLAILFKFLFQKRIKAAQEDHKRIWWAYHSNKDKQEVLKMLREHTKKFKSSFNGWTFYGGVAQIVKNYDESEKAFKKALALKPDIKEALAGLGIVYRIQGRHDEAKELFLKALKIDPYYATPLSGLSLIELVRGNNKKALKYGESAFRLNGYYGVIAAHLAVVYHDNSDFNSRDKMIEKAAEFNYHDLESLLTMFNQGLAIEELVASLNS